MIKAEKLSLPEPNSSLSKADVKNKSDEFGVELLVSLSQL